MTGKDDAVREPDHCFWCARYNECAAGQEREMANLWKPYSGWLPVCGEFGKEKR